jgi:hypothetical protein
MRRRWPRLLLLVVLFLGGSYAIVYGVRYHRVAFDVTKQRDVMVAVPAAPGDPAAPPPESGGNGEPAPPENAPPPESKSTPDDIDPFHSPQAGNGAAANSGNPFEAPPPPGQPNIPGIRLKKISEDYTEVVFDSEWSIVRDVTVGGVMRLANGHLKRTYSGKPPALCPT